ncbi:MAG: CRISPR-associated endonuclease Cas1 [Nitrospirae bacterium]|nr:CRISPR-associated endonuclease Cas1 [Nitrospirota bacterium]MBF0591234.1 CRISPR-associated endonuclease Cas1 [Nitrospirota bacterium]
MELVINTYGAYLRKNGECFVVKAEDKEQEISVRKVTSIMITTSALISTDAIKLALDHNVDIIFLDDFGNPIGRVWHCKLGSTVAIRRTQLSIADSADALSLVIEWITQKLQNQVDLINRLKKPRIDKTTELDKAIKALEATIEKLSAITGSIDQHRNTIMGLEGNAGRIYFETISLILPDRFKFQLRSRNPAKDEFNAMLNYAYGILYSLVEKGCIIAGLDPYIGFLHTDNYSKKSLVFDIIEQFRIYADEPVVYLFTGRHVKTEYFDKVKDGMTLNKGGKQCLIKAFQEHLDGSIRYKGRNIQRNNIIQLECHAIANGLLANGAPGNGSLADGSLNQAAPALPDTTPGDEFLDVTTNPEGQTSD